MSESFYKLVIFFFFEIVCMYDLIAPIAASVAGCTCRTRVISADGYRLWRRRYFGAGGLDFYFFWMARKGGSKKQQHSSPPDSDGMFQGMVVFLLPKGVQPRRLQVYRSSFPVTFSVLMRWCKELCTGLGWRTNGSFILHANCIILDLTLGANMTSCLGLLF